MSASNDYNEYFDKLRKNRVEVSFFKYGPASKNFGEGLVDALGTMEQCVEKYKKTGNTEYLVDAANYLMFEFTYPKHSNAHFKATDSSESAGIVGHSYNEMLKEVEEDY